jgi:hypothetical protein
VQNVRHREISVVKIERPLKLEKLLKLKLLPTLLLPRRPVIKVG